MKFKFTLLLYLFTYYTVLTVLNASNCSNSFCKDDWRPVGRFCIKFNEPVRYFSEANEICKNYAGLSSNLFGKSTFLDSELRILVNEINQEYPTKKSHVFWVT
jgi:hypothetical protein